VKANTSLKAALIQSAEAIHRDTGSDEASLEAEILLCHALGIDRARLYQQLGEPIGEVSDAFAELLRRRRAREPLAYIVGHREFFGLEFDVSPAALIPRPETEMLVEAVMSFATERFGAQPFHLADIGVGCGTIAVSVARALSNARVIATDVSSEALALAQRNAEKHGVDSRIEFREGDLLEPLTEPADLLAANLPYVTTSDWEALPPEIRDWEPRAALDGGPDGLRVIERFFRSTPDYLMPGGAVLAEIGDAQGSDARRIATETFPEAAIGVERDLAGKDRLLVVRLQ
jgi:release factor glutamine methyltransferase